MRTDISEDPKGDPTKILPNQPIPDHRQKEGIEPLLPGRGETPPPSPRPGKQTEADREQKQDEKQVPKRNENR